VHLSFQSFFSFRVGKLWCGEINHLCILRGRYCFNHGCFLCVLKILRSDRGRGVMAKILAVVRMSECLRCEETTIAPHSGDYTTTDEQPLLHTRQTATSLHLFC